MSGTTPFDCPRCGVALAMSERQGIEIDYCPQCRGVWLDRGELDKIIARSETAQTQVPPPAQPAPGSPAGGWTQPAAPPPQQQPWGGGQHGRYEDRGYGYGRGERKKKSWLGEIFD
jgi:Zn-finger nucleic acid-binding protein